MKIIEIINALEAIAPRALQESYDNSGLIVGDADQQLTGVLVSLDTTPEVVFEAVEKKCNLIVSHHPVIFKGLKQLTGNNWVENTVIEAIRNGISIYAIHTNLDNVLEGGVNGKIAQKLGLLECETLRSHPDHPDAIAFGAGVVGRLTHPMSEEEFLSHLKDRMQASVIRHTALLNRPVEVVAVCGGSGSFLLPDAIASKADFFVTGDFKYHEFFDAEGKIVIADIGHYESEQFTVELICEIITENFPKFAPDSSERGTNPIIYYT
jgi:dinuclear metal center YbgI/SA1388 family protein